MGTVSIVHRVSARCALAVAAVLLVQPSLAATAAAEDLSKMCGKVRDLSVGQWAEYRTAGMGLGGSVQMRLAVTGSQTVAGKKAYWLEMRMQGDQGPIITQVLTTGYPYAPDQIHEMVIKMGGQPAMKMPGTAMAMMRDRMGQTPNAVAIEKCGEARVVGRETVEVPAGSFEALHLVPVAAEGDGATDVWASEKIPFGVIKLVRKDGELVLLGHGTDAKSSIKETPLVLPGMG